MATKIFVGNLSFNTTQDDLQAAFAAHGLVSAVDFITDKFSGRPRGFAFVTMGNAEEAEAAIKALSGADLGGRSLTVSEARPREERAPGGGGFRDRGARSNY